MQGENFARFMELRGRRIVEAAGALWHSVEGRFYVSIPDQLLPDPDPADLERMLRSVKGAGARYPTSRPLGLPSGLYVRRQKKYDISNVHPKQRFRVRRGLERCEIRRVEESELLAQGLQLNRETMLRQGRYDSEFGESKQWRRLVEAVRRSPAVIPMGAFVGGRLAAFVITCHEDGWWHILHQMSSHDELKNYPNHALTFRITEEAAQDPNLEAICYGSMALVAGDGLHEYKLRFGYEVVSHNWAFQLHPAVAQILTSAPVARLVDAARRLRPHDQRLERAGAVLQGARLSRPDRPSESDLSRLPAA